MCGILYANSFNNLPVNDKIKEMYEAQKQRGREGFGIFDGQEMNIVHATKEERIMKWLNKYSSNLIMFHHRFPTSTINVKQAAHPFTTKKYFGDNQYILIHNGHINNSYSLKSDHEKLGINYHSIVNEVTPSGYNYKKFNDSESLLWDFALTMEGKQEELKAYGGMAFICVKLHKNKLEKLYFGRNTNPIKMQIDDEGVILSSTGDGEDAKEQTLYEFDYKTKKLTDKPFKIPSYTIYTAKNHSYERYNSGYEDYDYDREGNIREIADMYDNRYGGRQITSTATPVVKERYKPTLGEIYVTKIMYLSRVDGNYSKAYEEMEKDCLNLDWLHYDNSIADKHIAILEEAMESILSETTFIDDDSISPQYIKRHHRALKHHGTESIVVNELKEEGDE